MCQGTTARLASLRAAVPVLAFGASMQLGPQTVVYRVCSLSYPAAVEDTKDLSHAMQGGQLVIYGCMSGKAPTWPWQQWVFRNLEVSTVQVCEAFAGTLHTSCRTTTIA